MYLFERISNAIAKEIASSMEMDKDQEEIIAYGAFGFLQTLWSIILVTAFGLVFGVLLEILILSTTASLLRKYSGGVHASTPNRCAFLGVIVFGVFALLIKNYSFLLSNPQLAILASILLLISFFLIHKYSPVDSPNKPIKDKEVKKKLRRGSITLTFLIILIVLVFTVLQFFSNFTFNNIVISLSMGALWQSFMLTKTGHTVINIFDSLAGIPAKLFRR